MKKNISWQVLIIIGLVGIITGQFIIIGVIGNAIGVVGDICFLIGIVNMIIAFAKGRKEKNNISENTAIKIEKSLKNKNSDYKKYISYIPYGIIIILVLVIIFLINKNNKPLISSNESSIIEQLPEQKGDGSFSFNTEEYPENFIVGFWLNEQINTSYFFEKDKTLSIVNGENVLSCTYEINKQNIENNSVDIWFYCPMPDWQGYSELHYLTFSSDYKSFSDTKNIQAMIDEVPGKFIKVEAR